MIIDKWKRATSRKRQPKTPVDDKWKPATSRKKQPESTAQEEVGRIKISKQHTQWNENITVKYDGDAFYCANGGIATSSISYDGQQKA